MPASPVQAKMSAPPVYRPAASALQSKMAAPVIYRPAPPARPLAPPVYAGSVRLPVQAKTTSATKVAVASPSIYRPLQAGVAQPAAALAQNDAPRFTPSAAPAVYRPTPGPSAEGRSAFRVVQPRINQQASLQGPPRLAIFSAGTVVQRMKYVRRNGRIFEVADDYKKKDKERWAERDDFVKRPSGISADQKKELAQAEAERLEAARVQEAQRVEAARIAEERRQALRARKARLAKYPRRISRRDRNFANQQNSRGQGKAHMVGGGLAAAGATHIPPTEQLIQDSPNKGTSNLISFTGPDPNPGTLYGPADTAQEVHVKMRKLARAQIKGKADAQHLDLLTSEDLRALAQKAPDARQLTAYVRKDDEHQVRVRPVHGTARPVIAARFLVGPNGEEITDSDSESEDEG